MPAAPPPSPVCLWHVTLSVAGEAVAPAVLRPALERFSDERPFLLAARYALDRAEVRYWEEAAGVEDAAALAAGVWAEHRGTAGLPDWRVVGLEVLDRATFLWRVGRGDARAVVPAGIQAY